MMDFVLEAWVAALIEQTKLAWMLGAGRAWQPGERLEAALRRIQRRRATPVRMFASRRCCGRCGACWARRMSRSP